MYTLNNIVNLFQEFATNHYNLKGNFYFGVAGEHESKKGGIKYPLMVAELQASNIAAKLDTYDFKMWFMSQHKLHEGRDVEQLSDLKQIAGDFIIWLRQTKFNANVTFSIDENVVLTDFNHSFNDDVCGWYCTIKVKQFLDWDLCRIPMSGIANPDPNNGVKVYDQNNNLLFTKYPGDVLIVNDLTTVTETYTVTGTTQSTVHTPLVIYNVSINGQTTSAYTIAGSTITFTNALASDEVIITYAY